ncbi:MAG: hypothetical protein V4550_18405 [Gemmatimonadota bacterium]
MTRCLRGLDVCIGHGGGGHGGHHGGGGHRGGGPRGWGAWWGGPSYAYDLDDDDEEIEIDALVLGADELAHRQGKARDFGLLDSAYACIVGAHLSSKQSLEDYARQISGQILNQTAPTITASTFKAQLEALAGEIAKVTKRNPLDEVYSGPVFAQSQNDYFSGRVLDTPAHYMEEAVPDIKKKFDEATKSVGSLLTTLKWVGIAGAGAIILSLAVGLGFGVHSHVKR